MKINEIGNRYGRLVVIAEAEKKNSKRARWVCQCDCGNITHVDGHELRCGHTQSCGCKRIETIMKSKTTHHETHTRLYGVWKSMRKRCNCKTHDDYKYYGAKGIKVCEEWNDFLKFKEWAEKTGYQKDAPFGVCTIDRIDSSKGYSPDNCEWITIQEQQYRRIRGR